MKKTVFHWFFDFVGGQEKWLNDMAEKGWRLVSCGQLSYTFESCAPGEYQYAVEFVADKSHRISGDYRSFLEGMGYRTLYKNININYSVGKVRWRPWAKGMGQLATSPGGYGKELLIAEKRRDGTPFALHTDIADTLAGYRTLRSAYLWGAGGMLALTVMVFIFMFLGDLPLWSLAFALLPALFTVLYGIPAVKYARIAAKLREEGKTHQ